MTEKIKNATKGKKTYAVAVGLLLLAVAALAGLLPEDMRSEQIVGAAAVLVSLGIMTLRMAVADLGNGSDKGGAA